jgi:hypothetical protein
MRLFEFFDSTDAKRSFAVAVGNLKDEIENDTLNFDPEDTTDQLIQYFNDWGIHLSFDDLVTRSQEEPLNQVVANLNKKEVTFKGDEDETNALSPEGPTDQERTVEKMAKSAMKK